MKMLLSQALRALLPALFLVLPLAGPLSPALAQEATPAPAAAEAAPSAKELERLVATLENEKERAALVAQLKALMAAEKAQAEDPGLGGDLVELLSDRMEQLSGNLASAAAALGDAPKAAAWLNKQMADPETRNRWVLVITELLLVLAAAVVADLAAIWLVSGPRRRLMQNGHPNLLARSLVALLRWLLEIVPLAAAGLAAYGTLAALDMQGDARVAALTLTTAFVAAGMAVVLGRAFLAPTAGGVRAIPVGDETAHYLFIWLRRLVNTTVYGYFAIQALRLLGLPATGAGFAAKLLGLVVATMVLIVILQNRQGVAAWIRNHGNAGPLAPRLSTLRNRFADVWHVLAALYVVALFVIWALNVKGGFQYMLTASLATLAILVVATLLDQLIGRLMVRAFTINADLRAQYPNLETRANRYLPLLSNVLRGAVTLFAFLGILQAWGVDTFAWLATPSGRNLVGSAVAIGAVLVAAVVIWEAASAAIERYMSQTDEHGNVVERSARARTLLPLLRNVLMIFLVVMVSLIVLSEIGVNIAPLLAGAGVVGLAVGFGSQKLVQDVITGAFILFEDTISVGDIVKVDTHAGVVEAMTIRTLKLRDLTGQVHTIPFSSVTTVVNMTKDFSHYLLDVGVAYREDVDEVIGVMKGIAEELRQDPVHGPNIIEPLEVLGLDRFDASSVVIRARLKTLPGKQWGAGREFNRRMKKRFDELGIEIPFPHQTIYFGEDKEGRAPPLHLNIDRMARPARPERAKPAEQKAPLTDFPVGDAPEIGP